MISYAQNREDVVLARAFGDQVRGLYIDVGAEHPVLNSVTKHFYDQGWRGINIDPSPWSIDLLESERPADVNLGVGVGDMEAKATFYEGPPDNHGASTFRADVVGRYRRLGQEFVEIDDVPITTLALICEDYVGDRTIDFLKIDVEGFECEAVAGADWKRWRPRVVIIEATAPNDRTPTHEGWEPTLLSAGYVCALFDGLNRFYALEEHADLVQALSSPACVFDDYLEAGRMRERQERDAALRCLSETEGQLREHLAAAAHRESESHQAERRARIMEDRAHHAEDEALRAELGSAVLRDRLADESAARLAAEQAAAAERTAREATERELAAMRATKTFRWVAPLRDVYGLFRRGSR
jgi:FkbM family methyltransferase